MTSHIKQHCNCPHVSIIVLTYNGSDHIKPLFNSLMDQSYPKDRTEIIVVDNASTDKTLDILKENYPSVRVVSLEKNIGFAAGNNRGIVYAKHDLLVFLNQDTVCDADFLKSLVRVMVADKTIAASNPNIVPLESEHVGSIDRTLYLNALHLCDLSLFGYGRNRRLEGKAIHDAKLLSGCAFIIRRDVISKLGYLFDEQLWMYAEDTDLSLRIHTIGERICAIRDSLVYHIHDRSMAPKLRSIHLAARAIMNRVYVFFKNMGRLEFLLYFPVLLVGGNFKILEFPLSRSRKAVYFLPFGVFSMACMIAAIFNLHKFAEKRREVMRRRRFKGFPTLRFTLKQTD